MPCLGFPFINYSSVDQHQHHDSDYRPGLDDIHRDSGLTEQGLEYGTIPVDKEVTELDAHVGLAPSHQEKYHP